MEIDITRLKSGVDEYTSIDYCYSFSKEELKNSGISELNDVKIEGIIELDLDSFYLDIEVSGIMVIPCSITLKPVKHAFSFKIQEHLNEKTQESLRKTQNTIDIFPIVWENILVEVPSKVVSNDLSDVVTEGEGWRLITEKEEINPALEKLKDLL